MVRTSPAVDKFAKRVSDTDAFAPLLGLRIGEFRRFWSCRHMSANGLILHEQNASPCVGILQVNISVLVNGVLLETV